MPIHAGPARIQGTDQVEEMNVSESKPENEAVSAPSFELKDCGRASEKTCGVPLVLLFELGSPPFNKLFLF